MAYIWKPYRWKTKIYRLMYLSTMSNRALQLIMQPVIVIVRKIRVQKQIHKLKRKLQVQKHKPKQQVQHIY